MTLTTCDDCHHVREDWELTPIWVSDWVGTWKQWTCPRCLVRLMRDGAVEVEAPWRLGA